MDLHLVRERASGYSSGSQIARAVSEDWGERNLYCLACVSPSLARTPPNTPAVDFRCPRCDQQYQLKSGRRWNEHRVPDAAYSKMIEAIRSDRAPNLMVLQYSPSEWIVRNLLLVPRFFLFDRAIRKRRPLSEDARRARWIGCDIMLEDVPPEGKIRIVVNGLAADPADMRRQYGASRPLEAMLPEQRGWTLDVLRAVRSLNRQDFELGDVYELEPDFKKAHPKNLHIRDKIRQQLQVLRDIGILEFRGRGRYRLRQTP